MPDESVATIIIERPVTDGLGSPAALVAVDGQPIGRLKKGRPAVFTVPPGDRLVTVWPTNLWGEPIDQESLLAQVAENPPASIRLRLEPGARAELLCQSNQPRLHPLVWYAGGFFILVAVLGELGRRFPPVRAAQDSLALPLLVGLLAALVLGPVGLAIWLRRAWRAGGFRGTVVLLTLKGGEGVSVGEQQGQMSDGRAEPGAADVTFAGSGEKAMGPSHPPDVIELTRENLQDWPGYQKLLDEGKIVFDAKGRLRYKHGAPVGRMILVKIKKDGTPIYKESAEGWFDPESQVARDFVWPK